MTAARYRPHFGVTVPQIKRPWAAAADASRSFEAMGCDSLWVCDHLYGPQPVKAALPPCRTVAR